MQFDNLNLDELRSEAATDNEAKVRSALKTLVGGIDQAIEIATDPDELVELFEWMAQQAKHGRTSLRDHKPIAQLTAGGSESSPQFSPEVVLALTKLASHFNGDLEAALTFVAGLQEDLAGKEREINRLSAENSRLEKSSGAIDADEVARVRKLESDYQQSQTDLQQANDKLDQKQDEIDALRAQQPEITDLVRTLKKSGELKTPRFGTETFVIPGDKLKPAHRRILEV